jgi:hypothetical protein
MLSRGTSGAGGAKTHLNKLHSEFLLIFPEGDVALLVHCH